MNYAAILNSGSARLPNGVDPHGIPVGNLPTLPRRVGHHLKRRIELKGISVRFLAKRAEVNPGDVSNYLNGHVNRVGVSRIRRIRTALMWEGIISKPRPHIRKPRLCPKCGTAIPRRNH